MKVAAVLNRDGGTLKTTDLTAFCRQLTECFHGAGHDIRCFVVPGSEVVETLQSVAEDDAHDTVLAGGGDGTISAAAGIAWKAGKALGVLPAGTMNLFARSLGVPLDLAAAGEALAAGTISPCDIATANGRPFIHQYSVGLHPSIIQLREETPSRSRLEKMLNSARAAMDRFLNPPSFPVELDIDGERRTARVSNIAVSNNPYGHGHMPYADRLDGGVLGIYHAGPLKLPAMMVLVADLVAGRWAENPDLVSDTGHRVVLRFPRPKRGAKAAIDGELIPLANPVTVEIHPGELRVLRPAEA